MPGGGGGIPSNKPIALADPRVGNKNAPVGPISFILTQFLTKILPNYRLAPLLPGIKALPSGKSGTRY